MSEENKKTGDWNKAMKILDNVGTSVLEAGKVGLEQGARIYERTIVNHFRDQDLGWAGHSPAYAKYKKNKGLSTAILIATGTLMNSINVKMAGNRLQAFVGVLRAARKDGKPAVLIAAVHEFGSGKRNIPARPYLRPSFIEKKDDVKRNFERVISKALKSA